MRLSHNHVLLESTIWISSRGHFNTAICNTCGQTWDETLDPEHWQCLGGVECEHYWVPALDGAECEWCGDEKQPTFEQI